MKYSKFAIPAELMDPLDAARWTLGWPADKDTGTPRDRVGLMIIVWCRAGI